MLVLTRHMVFCFVSFVFVDQKLPTIQYSFLLHKGFGIIQVVCSMVSRLSKSKEHAKGNSVRYLARNKK